MTAPVIYRGNYYRGNYRTFNEGPRPIELDLEKYYDGDEEPTDPNTEADAAMWVMLRKASVADMDES